MPKAVKIILTYQIQDADNLNDHEHRSNSA